VYAVDNVEIILDFLLLTQCDCIFFACLEVLGGLDLVIFILALAEDFVALNEVGPDELLDFLLASYTLLEYVLQNVIVVRDLGFLVDCIGETVFVFFYIINFS